ncbi:RTA1 like protein-domain-containing protein [Ilyonectria robusta]|uniref:RTA1 like protein-domain-containing protein n=1 Tax=Ilyonectria robusta TaxID=1079257 RepID=UPI001E8D19E8|nr:RTA1 like protein-domain-containing protein [Ilyonectria robusta]KAH8664803.1 RTA1 like protein-domain-containing protein [Ilyonectria robusta]
MASGEFVLYHYDPSFAAAAIFVVLFSISAVTHAFQLFRARSFYMFPFLIGCGFEIVGYVGRAWSAKQTPNWATMPYVLQSLFLLLGPTLLAASIYMVLGRLIRLLNADNYSIIRTTWLTKVFVLGDVISFLAQSGGGGMLANAKTKSSQKLGENVIIGGLGVQIVFFGFFMVVTMVFHRRILNNPTTASLTITTPWKKFILVMYVASMFIMIRSVFRIAEYIGGSTGTLQSTEVYIYIFDATLMFIVVTLFNVFHPSRVMNHNERIKEYNNVELESYSMMDRDGRNDARRPQNAPNPYDSGADSHYHGRS